MTDDADALAQRYLALWTQYLTALVANPRAMETLQHWLSFTGQFAYPPPGTADEAGVPPWLPFFGPFGLGPAPPAAAQADGAAGLAHRVDELERRLAALERRLEPSRLRRRGRATGA
jgi:hypothetical protein